MIVLFTDFGIEGPYIGQMKNVLLRDAPQTPLIDLMHDAPNFDPHAAAYLLAALVSEFSRDAIFLGVVDPGVGSARPACVVNVDGRWFVGPDNGMFNVVAMRGSEVRWWDITWRPERLSASFHGRDLFAPVAAMLAKGRDVPGNEVDPQTRIITGWTPEYPQVIYIDHYGNAMTGIRAASVPVDARVSMGKHKLPRAYTFSDVPDGQGFWYENSIGLVEIAVNKAGAAAKLGIELGNRVHLDGQL